ncbi:MAG: universal stress protein, partial [Candidatus Eremiobacterota bacterium]
HAGCGGDDMISKILVPLDGSPLAEQALPYAVEMARKFSARLVLLRCMVLPEPVLVGMDMAIPQHYTDLQRIEREHVENYLAAVRERPELQGLVADARAPFGSPGEAILEFAEAEQCDLIVMSSHGRSGLSRFVYGSVAEKVLHHTPCPLLLVKASEKS